TSSSRPFPEVAAPLKYIGTTTAAAMAGRISRSGPTFRVPRSEIRIRPRMTRLRIRTLVSTSSSLSEVRLCTNARFRPPASAPADGLTSGGDARLNPSQPVDSRHGPQGRDADVPERVGRPPG